MYKNKPENIICINETSLKFFTVRKKGHSKIGTCCVVETSNQHRTQAIEGFFNILKSRLSNKKDLGYEKLC